jgi:hypothetical protein
MKCFLWGGHSCTFLLTLALFTSKVTCQLEEESVIPVISAPPVELMEGGIDGRIPPPHH